MDNKALVVTLVVVFVGGLVLGAASFGGFSGQVTRNVQVPLVSVSPTSVARGDTVTVYVTPRPKSDTIAYLYRVNEAGSESRVDTVTFCKFGSASGRECTSPTTFSYGVRNDLSSGQYAFRVYTSQADVGSGLSTYGQGTFYIQ